MSIINDLKEKAEEITRDIDVLNKAIIIKNYSKSIYVSNELLESVDKAISIIKVALDREYSRNANNKN
jgi:hypothetical protein